MPRRRTPKKHLKRLASARIDRLWEHSRQDTVTRPERAQRTMRIAQNIAQRARISLPRDISRQICKNCGSVFVPGRNCRMRIRQNRFRHISVTCLNCGAIRRFPVIRKS